MQIKTTCTRCADKQLCTLRDADEGRFPKSFWCDMCWDELMAKRKERELDKQLDELEATIRLIPDLTVERQIELFDITAKEIRSKIYG